MEQIDFAMKDILGSIAHRGAHPGCDRVEAKRKTKRKRNRGASATSEMEGNLTTQTHLESHRFNVTFH